MNTDREMKRMAMALYATIFDDPETPFRLSQGKEEKKQADLIGNDAQTYHFMAGSFMRDGCIFQAERYARRAFLMDPTRAEYLVSVVCCCLGMNSYDRVVQLVGVGLKKVHRFSGHLAAMRGLSRYGKACHFLKKGQILTAMMECRAGLTDLMESRTSIAPDPSILSRIAKELAEFGLLEQANALGTIAATVDPYCAEICQLISGIDQVEDKIRRIIPNLFSLDEGIRLATGAHLMNYESLHLARSFVALIEDPSPMMRELALLYLKRHKMPYWSSVVHLLYDEVPYVRIACAEYLASSNQEFALDHLELAIRQEEDEQVRGEMSRAASTLRSVFLGESAGMTGSRSQASPPSIPNGSALKGGRTNHGDNASWVG